MNIVVPMAGKSRRFFEAGYTLPKALLPVGRKTMIEQVVDLFDTAHDKFFFIVSESDAEKFKIAQFLRSLQVSKEICTIPDHDLGPTYSLIAIKDRLNPNDEVIVNYCDFLMEWDYSEFLQRLREGDYDGGIPSFRGFHPASLGDTYYAYMRVNDKNELLELREKAPFTNDRVREHASTGTYYFKRWQYVIDFGKKALDEGLGAGSNHECYASLLYNLMTKAGLRSLVVPVKKFICLGTPKDYEEYKFWYEYFTR